MEVKTTITTINGTLNLLHDTLVGQPKYNGMFLYGGDLHIDLNTITAPHVRLKTLGFLLEDDEPSFPIISSQCHRAIRHTAS